MMPETLKTLRAAHTQLRDLHNHLVADFEALVRLLIEKKLVDAADLQQRFSKQQAQLDEILARRRSEQRGHSTPARKRRVAKAKKR
jgi:hypothetical protein